MNYTDDVDGIIIGDVTFPYEFWIDEPRPEWQHKRGIPKRRVDKGFFRNDEEAVAWLKQNYPDEFKHGVEMRVFDRE